MSPILTAMFVNDYTPLKPNEIKVANFVDDFTFWQNPLLYRTELLSAEFAPHVYNPTNLNQQLQLEINHFLDWCKTNQLSISEKKCDHLFVCSPSQHIAPATITIGSTTLTPITRSTTTPTHKNISQPCIRVLGLYIDPNLTWDAHVQFLLDKATTRLYQLRQIVHSTQWHWKPFTIWRLYQSIILPILLQNITIYSHNTKSLTLIQKIHMQAHRLALGVPTNTNHLKLRKLLDSKTVHHWRDLKLTQFYLKCQLAPINTFAGQCWVQYYEYTNQQLNIRSTPLYRAVARMKYISNQI